MPSTDRRRTRRRREWSRSRSQSHSRSRGPTEGLPREPSRDVPQRGRHEEMDEPPKAEDWAESRALAVPDQRVERHVIGVQAGVACHVLHRPKPNDVGSGRKNIDKFLEEIKNKHITSNELTTQQKQVHVKAPERVLRKVIDMLAKYVAKYGEEFEEAVRADVSKRRHEILASLGDTKECKDIDFGFLGEKAESQQAQYYRWKAFALAQGDGMRHWRVEPFQMCQDGTIWHPPAEDCSESSRSRSHSHTRSASGSQGCSHSRSRSRSRKKKHRIWSQSRSVERKTRRKHQERRTGAGQPAGSGRLGRRERKELTRLLGALEKRSGPILEAMCWCLDKAECAVQIARELVEALLEAELTLQERIIRIFLISDVVHNSGSAFAMANAWCYRREFEAQLPEAFEHLHVAYRAEESRACTEKAGEQLASVLKSWQARAVFSQQYIKGLEVCFFRDIVPADTVAPEGATSGGRLAGVPEAIFVKLAEWRSQHFSQLEKLAKARGLNWQTMHIQRPEDGRSLEQVRKNWLLDRLVTYELHVWETRPAPAGPQRPETVLKSSAILVLSGSSKDQTAGSKEAAAKKSRSQGLERREDANVSVELDAGLVDEDIDGEPLTSEDEAWLAGQGLEHEHEPDPGPEEDERRRQAAAAAAVAAASRRSVPAKARTATASRPLPPQLEEELLEDIDGVPIQAPLPAAGAANAAASESDTDTSDGDQAPSKSQAKLSAID